MRYGAFAFLDNEEDEEHGKNINLKIEDILASKGKEKKDKKQSKKYQLQKSTFNIEENKKEKSGKGSKQKPDVNDPNFWEKVGLPFQGFNAKQLLKRYRSKKNEVIDTKEAQSKFLKDVSMCVKGILDAKTIDDSRTIDEEIYELLKKIQKNKEFESKYRDKAAVLLDKVLHFNEYREQLIMQEAKDGNIGQDQLPAMTNGRRMGRAAKANVDYKSNGLRKREANTNAKYNSASNTQKSNEHDEGDDDEAQRLLNDIDEDLENEDNIKKQKIVSKTDKPQTNKRKLKRN